MATISIPNFLSQKAVSGLNSYTFTAVTPGTHYCRMEVDHHSSSAATIAISRSGSVSATLGSLTLTPNGSGVAAPQSTAIVIGAANLLAGDVITFAVSSSAAIDQGSNNIKSRILARIGGPA